MRIAMRGAKHKTNGAVVRVVLRVLVRLCDYKLLLAFRIVPVLVMLVAA